eukprot:COSAG06_NODE_12444_length_1374_cov_0.585803_2_plen_70_part_01
MARASRPRGKAKSNARTGWHAARMARRAPIHGSRPCAPAIAAAAAAAAAILLLSAQRRKHEKATTIPGGI